MPAIDRLERPLTASAADSAPVRTPVATGFGLAVAVWLEGGGFRANALWRQVIGGPAGIRNGIAPQQGSRFTLIPALDGRPVAVALASDIAMDRWLQVAGEGLASSGGTPSIQQAALAYVPSRAPDFAELVARVYQLKDSEQSTFAQLLLSRDINQLAQRLGLTRAGARKRVEVLYRATNAAGLTGLVATTTRWLGEEIAADAALEKALHLVLGLTVAEARAGALLASGMQVPEVAAELRLSSHTVRDQARAAMARTGVGRLKDFAVLSHEVAALYVLATREFTRSLDPDRLLSVTRLIHRRNRQIGFADYGSPGQRPVLVCPGGMGMRRIGRDLDRELRARGLRPLTVERPGFGLTDPAGEEHHFAAACRDVADVLEQLDVGPVVLLSFDGGAAPAIEFANRYPGSVAGGVLVSPRPPRLLRTGSRFTDRFVRAAASRPEFIASWWRILRAQASPHLIVRLAERMVGNHQADRACLEDPTFVQGMVATLLTCGARNASGIAREQLAYRDWHPDLSAGAGAVRVPWAIVSSARDPFWGTGHPPDAADPWAGLRPVTRHRLDDGGRFVATTHAGPIADVVVDIWHKATEGAGTQHPVTRLCHA